MFRWMSLLIIALLLATPATAEVRLALIIDQTNYKYTSELSRVALASNEADQIEAALKDTGFKVTRRSDLTSEGLRGALDAFRLSLEDAGPQAVGFVYYTGHGAQHPQSRYSFLLGTEARLRGASDLAAYGVALETQKDAFASTGAKAIIMVFDACRNVAASGGYKSGYKGISRVEASADMLIAYSTDLDDVAAEGIYAPVLAEEIRRPGQTAETLFANVQRKVAEKTSRQQRPWYNPRLYNSVCLAGCSPVAVPTVASAGAMPAAARGSAKAQEQYRLGYAAYKAQDYAKARPRFEQACADGDMWGCHATATLYDAGNGVAQDYAEARSFYKRACDGGHMQACSRLGALYSSSQGGAQDLAETRRLYKLSCDGGDMERCASLGMMLVRAQGGPVDYSEARRLLKLACDRGVMWTCNELAELYYGGKGGEKDVVEAHRINRSACDGGYGRSCSSLGHAYKNGVNVPQDHAQAAGFFKLGCENKDIFACAEIGNLFVSGLGVAQDYAEARRVYKQACDDSLKLSCGSLGGLYENGLGGAQDHTEARRMYEKDCENHSPQGCRNLARLYENGIGVPQDYVEARRFYQQACDKNDWAGCEALRKLP